MENAFVFTSFSVNDLKAAKDFYVGVLGFELGADMTEDALKITKDGQRVHVYPKSDHSPASFTVLNFKVEDIEKVADELLSKGIKFEQYDNPYMKTNEKGIAERGTLKMAWFKDPSGNIHGLLQG
ncbi:MAG TPA: VOC family protein [Candidatus Saccharimonadia bacterium]|nr:VOC family protein [Candidatus Saccharimonadia bacterium]